MAVERKGDRLKDSDDAAYVLSSNNQITSVPSTTEWVKFRAGQVCATIHGSATAVTATVRRSARGPNSSGQVVDDVPADTTGFTGNPSTGIVPLTFTEPTIGWWAITVTAMTGTPVFCSLSGLAG